jgi:hypothetical protein
MAPEKHHVSMNKLTFDISRRRFSPLWLLIGAVIGRSLGLSLGLNLGFWYFASIPSVMAWQICVAVIAALFYSFLMTSPATRATKGALLGLGSGFAVAMMIAEIWSNMPGRIAGGLVGLSVSEGIFIEWAIMHSTWLGLIIGWIIGASADRRIRRMPQNES